MTTTILQGDCIESMGTLPERSVHACVTSLDSRKITDGIQSFRFLVNHFEPFDIFIGEAFVCDSTNASVAVWKVSKSNDLGPVNVGRGLHFSQPDDQLRLPSLYPQQRKKPATCGFGLCVGHGPAKQLSTICVLPLLDADGSAKQFGQHRERSVLDHLHLNRCVIADHPSVSSVFAPIDFIDPDASFAVNNPRSVSKKQVAHK